MGIFRVEEIRNNKGEVVYVYSREITETKERSNSNKCDLHVFSEYILADSKRADSYDWKQLSDSLEALRYDSEHEVFLAKKRVTTQNRYTYYLFYYLDFHGNIIGPAYTDALDEFVDVDVTNFSSAKVWEYNNWIDKISKLVDQSISDRVYKLGENARKMLVKKES